MDKVNLYDISKSFYQRSNRNQSCLLKAEAYSVSRDLWNEKRSKRDLIKIISVLKKIERSIPGLSVFFADRAEKAVRNDNYFVRVPYAIAHRYNDRPGRVYILTSKSRPGECKLGATTLSMRDRCEKYESRYGYDVSTFFFDRLRQAFRFGEESSRQDIGASDSEECIRRFNRMVSD